MNDPQPNEWSKAWQYTPDTYVPAKWKYGEFTLLLFDTVPSYVQQDGSREIFASRWKVLKDSASWNEAVHVSSWEWA